MKRNIWVINSDGTNPVQLTTEGNVDYNYIPSWSPNGNKIAYTDEGKSKARDYDNYIIIINTDSSNPTKIILPNEMGGCCPVWSKDGKRLLIVTKRLMEKGESKYTLEESGVFIITLPESVLQ